MRPGFFTDRQVAATIAEERESENWIEGPAVRMDREIRPSAGSYQSENARFPPHWPVPTHFESTRWPAAQKVRLERALRRRRSPSLLPSFVRVAFSILTFVHTNPRSAHFKPDCDNSFDGDIGSQMIYGMRRTIDMGDFERRMSGRVWTFDRLRQPAGNKLPGFRMDNCATGAREILAITRSAQGHSAAGPAAGRTRSKIGASPRFSWPAMPSIPSGTAPLINASTGSSEGSRRFANTKAKRGRRAESGGLRNQDGGRRTEGGGLRTRTVGRGDGCFGSRS